MKGGCCDVKYKKNTKSNPKKAGIRNSKLKETTENMKIGGR